MNLRDYVGKEVTLAGEADDAHAGAIVLVDDIPVYVSGLTSWDPRLRGQVVEVTGTLRMEDHGEMVTEDGLIKHGIAGIQWIVDNPQWRLAEEGPGSS